MRAPHRATFSAFAEENERFWTGAALAIRRREMNAQRQLQSLNENRASANGSRELRSISPVKRYVIASLLILTLFLLGYQQVRSQSDSTRGGFDLVDKAGNIRKPPDYRDRYQAFGTYMVLNPKGNEIHVTYASPGAAENYRKTGKFADGTVLVKEVFGTDHAQMTTGDAHWASGTKVWFVMIKDEKGRYSSSPLWGDGWGWALYNSAAPDNQVATDYKKDCLGCHIPARGTDWVYVQGYPVLAAK
jgi:hypothetical protein